MAYVQLQQRPDHVMEPPRGAHPVQAPFKRTLVNGDITGVYIVQIATINHAPDVALETVNGHIDTTIYFQGGLPRRIGVSVHSVNGQIGLALPEQQHAQHLDIRTQSTNGQTNLKLPQTFKGYLRLSSINGHLDLSSALRKNSKLISGDERNSATYCITPPSIDVIANEKGEHQKENEMDDNCVCESVSGQITVEYASSGLNHLSENEEIDANEYAWTRSNNRRECCIVA